MDKWVQLMEDVAKRMRERGLDPEVQWAKVKHQYSDNPILDDEPSFVYIEDSGSVQIDLWVLMDMERAKVNLLSGIPGQTALEVEKVYTFAEIKADADTWWAD